MLDFKMVKLSRYFYLIVPFFLGCATINQDSKPELIILNYGVYFDDKEPSNIEFDANSTSGIKWTTDPIMVCQTKNIPMELGVSFGVRYKVIVPEEYRIDHVDVETHHPKIRGYSGQESTINHWQSEISHYESGGYVGGAQFFFEENYELKSGEWKIVVKYKDLKVEKVFNISRSHPINMDTCIEI